MNNIEILEKLKDEQYDKETLKTICEFYDEEFKPYVLSTEEREAIENLIKENKELKEKYEFVINNNLDDKYEEVLEKTFKKYIDKDYIPKSKVKEKMQNDIKTNEHVILGGRRNGKTLEYGKRLGRIEMCEELLEEGE